MPARASRVDRRVLIALPAAAAAWLLVSRLGRPSFDITEVGIDAARALIAADAIVVDVRPPEMFAFRHLAGALNAPLDELTREIPAALVAAKTRALLVYCGDGVTHGPEATALLNRAGYAGAVNLKQGIEGWAAAGLPLEYGKGKTS